MSKRPSSGTSKGGSRGPPTLISNIEVLELLEKRVAERKMKRSSLHTRHRDWVEKKVVEYLKMTPCTKLKSAQERQKLESALTARKKSAGDGQTLGFGLTQAESLQIINSMPTEPVEIHLLIEELQSRMTERRQDELLSTVASYMKDNDKDANQQVDETGESEKEEENEELEGDV